VSRTRHRREDRPTRRAAPSTLTKGKKAGEYIASHCDEPSNRGVAGSWARWLSDYNGYSKQRKRRRVRKLMKTYGRRIARRAGNTATKKDTQ
jgi:hypothetical protein